MSVTPLDICGGCLKTNGVLTTGVFGSNTHSDVIKNCFGHFLKVTNRIRLCEQCTDGLTFVAKFKRQVEGAQRTYDKYARTLRPSDDDVPTKRLDVSLGRPPEADDTVLIRSLRKTHNVIKDVRVALSRSNAYDGYAGHSTQQERLERITDKLRERAERSYAKHPSQGGVKKKMRIKLNVKPIREYKPYAAPKTFLLRCKACNVVFKTLLSLHDHLETHKPLTDRRTHLCIPCDKSYLSFTALYCHQKTAHPNCYVYRCYDCAKMFGVTSKYLKHIRAYDSNGRCSLVGDVNGERCFTSIADG